MPSLASSWSNMSDSRQGSSVRVSTGCAMLGGWAGPRTVQQHAADAMHCACTLPSRCRGCAPQCSHVCARSDTASILQPCAPEPLPSAHVMHWPRTVQRTQTYLLICQKVLAGPSFADCEDRVVLQSAVAASTAAVAAPLPVSGLVATTHPLVYVQPMLLGNAMQASSQARITWTTSKVSGAVPAFLSATSFSCS
jgi:hypothetical protein